MAGVNGDSVLQAIHVYNGTHGFSVCKAELPLGIRLNMDGQEIVTILGEPDGKMGGAHGGPISLAYKDKGNSLINRYLNSVKGKAFGWMAVEYSNKPEAVEDITARIRPDRVSSILFWKK
ncbi:hypothetical protein SUGI_0795490 [Cryptomeria japonica]|nr:hypothetical protein SUGI_0795490 [Cryptomeria japonica]